MGYDLLYGETKSQFKQRLEHGNDGEYPFSIWPPFIQIRNFFHGKKYSDSEAYFRAASFFPKRPNSIFETVSPSLAEPEGAVDSSATPSGPPISPTVDSANIYKELQKEEPSIDAIVAEWKRRPKSSMREDVMWALRFQYEPDIHQRHAPSLDAWLILNHMRQNVQFRDALIPKVLERLMPSPKEVEKADKFTDKGENLCELMDEIVAAEKEARAQCPALEDCPHCGKRLNEPPDPKRQTVISISDVN